IRFSQAMDELSAFIADDLSSSLDSEAMAGEKSKAEDQLQKAIQVVTEPFEKELKEESLAMININGGQIQQTIIVPVIEGKIMDPQSWSEKVAAGEINEKTQKSMLKKQQLFSKKLEEISRKVSDLKRSEIGRASCRERVKVREAGV